MNRHSSFTSILHWWVLGSILLIPAVHGQGQSIEQVDFAGVLPHQTDFLTAGCRTHTYAGLSAFTFFGLWTSARQECLKAITARGYTHFYLYPYNENDYGGPSFDYHTKPQAFRPYLEEVIDAGLKPVVWLFPDNAPDLRGMSLAQVKARLSSFIPGVDDLVNSYVLGLELNEYWDKETADELGSHLRDLTDKLIGVHQTPRRWDYCLEWCDYMVLQYGFGETAAYIKSLTEQAIAELGKPVVAGEYNIRNPESESIKLGDAGVAAGASGFGNGGTPLGGKTNTDSE